jgi:hypothetical protein
MIFKEQKAKLPIKIKPFSGFSNPSLQKVLPQPLRESFDGIAQCCPGQRPVVD